MFTSKLIDGRFPDYRRVLPRNATRIVEGNWETLKQAFVRAFDSFKMNVYVVCV